jgi:hypothetical protein
MVTLADILNPRNWKGKHLFYQEESASTIKYVDKEASRIHTIVEDLNKVLITGKYVVHTSIVADKSEKHYSLSVEIKYYANKKKHKHKENSHRQEVNI